MHPDPRVRDQQSLATETVSMPFPSNTADMERSDFSDCCPVVWPRAIVLVDMNAFFASIEQRDHPEWRGRPVAITNGRQGTCIITCSYEARAYGIKTGMRLREARRLCPELIQCPAHPERYAATSAAISLKSASRTGWTRRPKTGTRSLRSISEARSICTMPF